MMNQMIELNNFGVAFLEAGQLSQSLNLFREVLQLGAQEQQSSAKQNHNIMAINSSILDAKEQERQQLLHQQLLALHLEPSSLAPNSSFVHSRGFNILPCAVAAVEHGTDSSVVLATLVSCIALFNLGLVHHMRSLTIDDQPTKVQMIELAHKIYIKCNELLHATGIQNLGNTGCVTLDLLYMALLNNLTQITIDSHYHHNNDMIIDANHQDYTNELLKLCSVTTTSSSSLWKQGGKETLLLMKKKFLCNAMISRRFDPASFAAHAA